MVGLVAVIWLTSVVLNNYIVFSWTEEEAYLHWIYVPAGVRILLIMLFGWRGAAGMMLGALPPVADALPGIGPLMVLVIAAGGGLMAWMTVTLFSFMVRVRHPWTDLDWWHLPVLALATAFANEVFLNSQLVLLSFEERADFAGNVLTGMIGNFLGALVLLLTTLAGVRLLRVVRR